MKLDFNWFTYSMKAKIEAIMEELYWEHKNSSESYCHIPNLVRGVLEKHLSQEQEEAGELNDMLDKHYEQWVEIKQEEYTPENVDKFMNDKWTPIPRKIIKL